MKTYPSSGLPAARRDLLDPRSSSPPPASQGKKPLNDRRSTR
jgi:hypothetical protein